MLITEGINTFKRASRPLSSCFFILFLCPNTCWEEPKHYSRCFYRTEGKNNEATSWYCKWSLWKLHLKKIYYKTTKTLISSEKKIQSPCPFYPTIVLLLSKLSLMYRMSKCETPCSQELFLGWNQSEVRGEQEIASGRLCGLFTGRQWHWNKQLCSSTVSLLSPSLAGLAVETRSSGPAFSEGSLWDKGACHRPLETGWCVVVLVRDQSWLNPEALLASIAQESKP